MPADVVAAQIEVADADDQPTVSVIYLYVASAVVWLLVGSVYGTLAAWKLVWPDMLPFEWLSFGRIRPVHTNTVLLGWLSVGLTGLAYLVVYRTTRRPIYSPQLARVALWLWNLALLAGLITLSLGMTRGPLEYREWIEPVAAAFALGGVLNGFNIFMMLRQRRTEEIYISDWFILGAFIWLPVFYAIAYLPGFGRGVASIVVQGYYMHVVLGLWFTPLILGITYWALPRILRKPIYSYALGVLAFWANLVFYPLIGAHHYIFAPIPWWLQSAAIVLGLGMLIPVAASVGNFLLTMQGSGALMRREIAAWFILAGTIGYGAVSLQGSLQAFHSANLLLHFTNNTVGHAHLAAYGFVSLLLFGAIYGLLPRLFGSDSSRLYARLHFHLAVGGLALYVVAMSIAGVLQGLSWGEGAPFIASVVGNAPWYVMRAIGGSLMAASHVVLAWNLYLMRQPEHALAPGLMMHPEPAE